MRYPLLRRHLRLCLHRLHAKSAPAGRPLETPSYARYLANFIEKCGRYVIRSLHRRGRRTSLFKNLLVKRRVVACLDSIQKYFKARISEAQKFRWLSGRLSPEQNCLPTSSRMKPLPVRICVLTCYIRFQENSLQEKSMDSGKSMWSMISLTVIREEVV